MTCLEKDKQNFSGKDGVIGQVIIGSNKNPVCVPGNSIITVLGQTHKIPSKIPCLFECIEYYNLPPLGNKQVCGHNKGKECSSHSDKHHTTECLDMATLVGH